MSKLGSVIKQFDDFYQWLEGYDYTKIPEKEFQIFCDKVAKLHSLTGETLDCVDPIDEDEEGENDESL